jgi:mevalonate kinase
LQTTKTYTANGKLLLTGEYLVLDGANALALPTKLGQYLTVETDDKTKPIIHWQSYNSDSFCWFEAKFDLVTFEIIGTTSTEIAKMLIRIFEIIQSEKNDIFDDSLSYKITTTLDFDKNWGLGTSSTLISLVSQWSGVDPFLLLEFTFRGSGYDIACATVNNPFVYNIKDKSNAPKVTLHSNITENLYFIYLNKKMNSRSAMEHYNESRPIENEIIETINNIAKEIIDCSDFQRFCGLIQKHENIIAEIIEIKPVQELLFGDYKGQIKSLGAWGGDFILAASDLGFEHNKSYFKSKGYSVFFDYKTLIH